MRNTSDAVPVLSIVSSWGLVMDNLPRFTLIW